MTTAIAFIDRRNGHYCAMLEGQSLGYERLHILALVAHSRGITRLVEPPQEEGWPWYVGTDARFYVDVNEEIRIIRDLIRDHAANGAHSEDGDDMPPVAAFERLAA